MQMPVLQDKHSVVYGQQLYGTLYRTARFHQFQTKKKKNGPSLNKVVGPRHFACELVLDTFSSPL